MTDIDFVRDGIVGDKVHDPRFGDGVLEKVDKAYSRPICVRYKYDHTEQYEANGMWGGAHTRPVLCWGHRAPLDQGCPPERFDYPLEHWTEHTDTEQWIPCDKPVWKPIKPTWCLVSDQDTAWIKKPMLVLGYIEDYSHPYITSSGDAFLHTKPCRKKDIPKWRPKERA